MRPTRREMAKLWIAAVCPLRYVVGDVAYVWAWLGALRILGGDSADR